MAFIIGKRLRLRLDTRLDRVAFRLEHDFGICHRLVFETRRWISGGTRRNGLFL